MGSGRVAGPLLVGELIEPGSQFVGGQFAVVIRAPAGRELADA